MTVDGILLTPGAGSTRDHSSLVALESALAPLPVRRHDFPYRREGRKAPDRAPKAVADVVDAAGAFVAELGCPPDAVVLGGRSFGGRMCSMAVAEGLPAAGLILVCYPLHPPGKPDRLRTEHFPQLHVPCLFVSGTRDAFGTPDELATQVETIPGPVTQVWVEGKGHDLRGADQRIVEAVRAWLSEIDPRG